MKTKTLIMLCLITGIGFTQLSAQDLPPNGNTGSVSHFWVWDGYYTDIPVNCNNDDVDRLVGKVTVHNIDHYKGGELVWVKQQFDGEVTSALTGEVFKVKDILKAEAPFANFPGHVHLVGNKGSHYMVFYVYDMNTDIFSFIKAVCN